MYCTMYLTLYFKLLLAYCKFLHGSPGNPLTSGIAAATIKITLVQHPLHPSLLYVWNLPLSFWKRCWKELKTSTILFQLIKF